MTALPEKISQPESFPRVMLCRVLSFAAVLSLWHVPDWGAAAIFAAGVAIYYLPHPAAAPLPPPAGFRLAWFSVAAGVAAVYLSTPSPAPAGSVVPAIFKYGLFLFFAIQVAFDFYRRAALRRGAAAPDD